MSDLSKPTADDLNDLGFCLGQAFTWLSRCRHIGTKGMEAEDPDAVERMNLAIANGVARIYAHIDLIGHTAEFVLNLDDGPDGAREIPLFSQGFVPPETRQ